MKKYLILSIFAASLMMAAAPSHFASAMTGSGTVADPFLISTCDDLQAIPDNTGQGVVFWLANDISCSATAGWNSGAGFMPIQNFQGTLDGRGHTITGLTINLPGDDEVGLFGQLIAGNVFNLHLSGGSIVGNNTAGSIAGIAEAGAMISGVTSNVSLSGDTDLFDAAGGLVGEADDITMSRSSYTGSITGHDDIGGLIGSSHYQLDVSDSFASSSILGSDRLGGLIGYTGCAQTQTVTRSYAVGSIGGTTTTERGGLIGQANSTNCDSSLHISHSFAGVSFGNSNVGGIIYDVISLSLSVLDTYFDSNKEATSTCLASVDGDSTITGFGCGTYNTLSTPNYLKNSTTDDPLGAGSWNFNTIWQTSSGQYPSLQAVPADTYGAPDAPTGLAITHDGLAYTVSWTAPASSTVPLQSYTVSVKNSNVGWDDDSVDNESVQVDEGTSYSFDVQDFQYDNSYDFRVVANNSYGSSDSDEIDGTQTGDVQVHDISSCADLEAIDDNPDEGTIFDTFDLTQDISCADVANFTPIGLDRNGWSEGDFSGTFDGQGHTISDLHIDDTTNQDIATQGYTGLFFQIYDGTVKNLTLHNGSVKGSEDVGAVAGEVEQGTVLNVHSDLDVIGAYDSNQENGGQYIGGLVGEFDNYGYNPNTEQNLGIGNSSSSGNVTGTYEVGGIVGLYYSSPENDDGNPVIDALAGNTFTGTVSDPDNAFFADEGPQGYDTLFGGIAGYVQSDNSAGENTSDSIYISNNTASSSDISGGYYVGGLIGMLQNNVDDSGDQAGTTVANNTIDATVTSRYDYVGGLIGYEYGESSDADQEWGFDIQDNSIQGSVTGGGSLVGGLIGQSDMEMGSGSDNSFSISTIADNRVLGNVMATGDTQTDGTGGLIGNLYRGNGDSSVLGFADTFNENYVIGNVTSQGADAGGLIGNIATVDSVFPIRDSFFNGDVSSNNSTAGGIIGSAAVSDIPDNGAGITISRSYAVGNVSVDDGVGTNENGYQAGGLVGYVFQGRLDIDSSFAANHVTANADDGVAGAIFSEGDPAGVFHSVLYDDAKNNGQLSCSGVGQAGDDPDFDCNPVDTAGSPNANYFFSTFSVSPFASGDSWDFDDVWSAQSGYPVLRLYEHEDDPQPEDGVSYNTPSISEVTPVPSVVTGSSATYSYSATYDEGDTVTVHVDSCDAATVSASELSSSHTNTIDFSGLTVGTTYQCDLYLTDTLENTSNTLTIGPFTRGPDPVNASSGSSGGSSGGGHRSIIAIASVSATTTAVIAASSTYPYPLGLRDLTLGMSGNDVKALQHYLDLSAYPLAATGIGSLGSESSYFGTLTRNALAKWQKAHKVSPSVGYYGKLTRAAMGVK